MHLRLDLEATMDADSQTETGAHSHAEVLAAVDRLTSQDLARLQAAARIWIRDLGLDTVVADADDMVSDAIFRTTSGQRAWRVGVSFRKHLRGVMRSMAESWRKSAERRADSGQQEVRESELLAPDAELLGDADATLSPVDNAGSWEPGAEQVLLGREEIRAFEDRFAEDEVAAAVIHGMWEELTGPEIQEQWHLTAEEYAAAIRRIRRFAHRKGDHRGD